MYPYSEGLSYHCNLKWKSFWQQVENFVGVLKGNKSGGALSESDLSNVT